MEHWGDAYFGQVYLEAIDDLLTPRLAALEAEVIAALLGPAGEGRVLDVACGHARHAWPLAARGAAVVGLDRSAAFLKRGRMPPEGGPASGRSPALVRGDLRALPFAPATFDAAYSWYASLFMFDDAVNVRCLAEVARVVRPGGRVVVQHANPLALAREPRAHAHRLLADGTRVEEDSAFDPRTGVDRSTRRLVRGGGVVAATAELRYYRPAEWMALAAAAGLRIVEITTTPRAATAAHGGVGPDAPDLIALLEKPT